MWYTSVEKKACGSVMENLKQKLGQDILCTKKQKIRFVLCVSIFLIFALLIVFNPSLKLYGEKEVSISVFDTYVDRGYSVFHLLFDLDDKVQISGEVNTKVVSDYTITYQLDFLFFHKKISRIVHVVDNQEPSIILNGSNPVMLCPNHEYVEEGYSAFDHYDGDLTEKVEVEKVEQGYLYHVFDSSFNSYSVVREIQYVDTTAPTIELLGSSDMTIYLDSAYQEPGYHATDNCDGDITDLVEVQNSVDIHKVGTYQVLYKVMDTANHEVEVTRTVHVVSKPVHSGVIYLTFDDGPSSTITPYVLDILKEENVSATFFVIHHDSSLDYLIQRAYHEGHAIGLHSYTHQYGQVYASVDAYFQDLDSIDCQVYQLIGIHSKLIRFPGGSSNTVSRRYSSGIMSILVDEVARRGYRYFDWNVSSGDAGGAYSSSDVYRNVVNGLVYNRENVVLMHDFSNNYITLNALRDIIHYGKEHGYVFQSLDFSSYQAKHGVLN